MEKERLENNRSFKGRNSEERRDGQPGRNGQSQRRDASFQRRDGQPGRNPQSAGKPGFKKDFRNSSGRPSPFYDKDKDSAYEKKEVRRKPQSASRDKEKIKEQQPDKMEVVKRLEKEKKAMQKKSQDKKKNQSARPQQRVKRTNNVDWTREYENDSFDDDDMYFF